MVIVEENKKKGNLIVQAVKISPKLPFLILSTIAFISLKWKVWTKESFQKYVEFDRPGERSPE